MTDYYAGSLTNIALSLGTNSYTLIRSLLWWNHSYAYRRSLQLSVPPTGIPAGHVLTVRLPVSVERQGKIRSDYSDIEIVYLQSSVPEQWVVLDRTLDSDIVKNDQYLEINCVLDEDLAPSTVNSGRLYIYYGNPNLNDKPDRNFFYQVDPWPLIAYVDDKNITYTNPGLDWVDGASNTTGARASFAFWGPQASLYFLKNQSQGFVEIQVDDNDWETVDLFSVDETEMESSFEVTGLAEGRHQLRIRVVGRSRPAAKDCMVTLKRIAYRNHSTFVDMGEQHDETMFWSGGVLGV